MAVYFDVHGMIQLIVLPRAVSIGSGHTHHIGVLYNALMCWLRKLDFLT